jgi:hypothetical protein
VDLRCLCAVQSELTGEPISAAEHVEHVQQLAQVRAETRAGEAERLARSFRIASVSCGARHSVALTTTGRVFTWGSNSSGQLGLGDRVDRNAPVQVNMTEGWGAETVACVRLCVPMHDARTAWQGCDNKCAEWEVFGACVCCESFGLHSSPLGLSLQCIRSGVH